MITATAIGRISRPGKIVRPEGKTAFCSCTIVSEKKWGDKTFSQYVEIITYGRDIENLAPTLAKDALVCVSGECGIAKATDPKYTNIKIMGTPMVLLGAGSAPRQTAPATRAAPPTTTTPAAKEDDDDSVPF